PPDDPYGIKKDDLVSSLRKCLAATNQFAPFCLPLLMEKLSSDIIDAKIDSLLTLSACLEVYHSKYLLEHLEPLWTAIKSVVFHSVNSMLEEAGLTAVTSIVRNLCGSMEENTKEKYEEFLEIIQRDCFHFTGADVKLMKPCGRILQAAALAAEPACQKRMINSTFPLLLEQFTQDIEASVFIRQLDFTTKRYFIGNPLQNFLRLPKHFIDRLS
ncbi:mms19 nucleotide excision repair, partial [Desmophyllum pertusum]